MRSPHKKRVLIVDDAVVVRKTLSEAITADPALTVAGIAANGRIALERFSSLKPDLVLLDIEMPEMDGLETVREIRKLDARVPILMFSSLTERGAAITLDALALGATDYATKPSNLDMAATLRAISRELIPKILVLCRVPESGAEAGPALKPAIRPLTTSVPSRPPSSLPPQIVAIGVSTGGPDALVQVLSRMPADFPLPVVIAQHMPPIFTSLLASRLTAKSAFPVRECVSGEQLAAGCAILAPGDFHMVVDREDGVTRVRTHQGEKENFCRPAVDVLFRSVAQTYGGRVLAVVLTGMGKDGLKGCEMLRSAGARIFVQDEASSVVWGMPGFVARAGLADKIVPLDHMAAEIMQAVGAVRTARAPA